MMKQFLQDESGATAIEYALIVTFLFLAIVTAIHYYADHVGTMYNHIGDAVDGATH